MSNRAGAIRRAAAGLAVLTWSAACFRARPDSVVPPRWSADLTAPRLFGDTSVTDTIAFGALHRAFLVRQGPWAVHVLDIDRDACWSPVAVKGAAGAAGRRRTSSLTASLASSITEVAGGVNADFFLFAPPGVPTGAHVSGGAVVTGPGPRPVFAVDSAGRPWIGVLSVSGIAVSALDSMAISSWNRLSPTGLAWMDARYGPIVDTLTGSVRVVMSALRGNVQAIDTGLTPTRIPSSGGVLVLGPRAAPPVRERFLLAARSRGHFDIDVRLRPLHPREAVGGFPVLVRDSLEVPGLDSAGAATFAPVRHPRTIVGVASGGRRLLLITIDGRQPGYSVGTTNRESARVALALGATEAINLDGGGSTAMVIARAAADSTRFQVANRPSDPQGERAVGNALVIVRRRAAGSRLQGREKAPGQRVCEPWR
jgi:hypothetical protein